MGSTNAGLEIRSQQQQAADARLKRIFVTMTTAQRQELRQKAASLARACAHKTAAVVRFVDLYQKKGLYWALSWAEQDAPWLYKEFKTCIMKKKLKDAKDDSRH